jgi:hypothetical protein
MKITAVITLLFLSLLSWGAAGENKEKVSPAYHLYIGFTATASCVPADGPYLTKLSELSAICASASAEKKPAPNG